jgi:hypothetical protein
MIEFPQGFHFRGVYCYPSADDPASFFYIPAEPAPERGPSGQPTLTLWMSDQGALLQFGTQWSIDGDTLEALRQQIERQFADLDPASIRLSPAPTTIESVTLNLADASGAFSVLQSQSSSGFPPFSAIFNLSLSAEQKPRAASALNGQPGLLRVTYHGALSVAVAVSTTIAGDVREDVSDLARSATLDDASAQIEQALRDGRLLLTQSHPDSAPDDLVTMVDTLAREKAAALLLNMAKQLPTSAIVDASKFSVNATRTITQNLPLESATDIASWFPAGSGAGHMRVIGTSLPPEVDVPASSAATVTLGFELDDAPINFIELRRGDVSAVLQGPNFPPVTLSSASGPLSVKTNYTDGGAAFEAYAAAPAAGSEWTLGPADLGLVQVTVDGSARQSAGAEEIRLHIAYCPSRSGSEDDRYIHLNDRGWIKSWFVVSRSAGLAGSLEYDWKEIARDGAEVKHDSTSTETPQITL